MRAVAISDSLRGHPWALCSDSKGQLAKRDRADLGQAAAQAAWAPLSAAEGGTPYGSAVSVGAGRSVLSTTAKHL